MRLHDVYERSVAVCLDEVPGLYFYSIVELNLYLMKELCRP